MTISPADAICAFVPPFLRFLREGTAQVDLSPARFQILQALDQEQPCSMVDLAERLSVTKRNITTLVDGLEGDGLAMRRPHPTDRRSKLVALTKDGEATFREAAKFQRKHLESLIANLEPAQQDVLVSALVQLTDAITTKRGA
ncbi:MarR family winged helix-turn-helix transcriptional regulator [Hoeflea sp.]|uniref:MarR family winged helix-turn-helix transcriptional regulator n=1 Tax=Hoeflea sp. TaxID=1940281 RepID=UPI003B026B3B